MAVEVRRGGRGIYSPSNPYLGSMPDIGGLGPALIAVIVQL